MREAAVRVERSAIEKKLQRYEELLRQWNKKINLIAPGTVVELRQRHIEDCLQLEEYFDNDKYFDGGRNILDIGSGAGLPGMILAILGHKVQLVESDQRKSVFLEEAARVCGVDAKVFNGRVEKFAAAPGGVITARAFAPLAELFKLTKHLQGDYLLMKGANAQAEIDEAKGQGWQFMHDMAPSRTGSGFILIIRQLQEGV